jgi:hypothetical protein
LITRHDRSSRCDGDKPLEGTWEEFEAWIRDTLGSDFVWKIRPADTRSNREMIATLIKNSMARNNGVFPGSDAFIERVEE